MFTKLSYLCSFYVMCDYYFFFIPRVVFTFSFFLDHFHHRLIELTSLSQVQCLAQLVLPIVCLCSILSFLCFIELYFAVLFLTLLLFIFTTIFSSNISFQVYKFPFNSLFSVTSQAPTYSIKYLIHSIEILSFFHDLFFDPEFPNKWAFQLSF